ncbi:uncharacterized protein LOC130087025 [Rhinichthys klamathensis goyatoka]|uniref:uncharacterized protein LOC130087025 n=1 Tax=Rhinichthys klamathensis goyatoka TaxID=3034132 RepID=UPI0024B5EE7E|nr:uncharacterized protein LOC130087025 [Rhinichthys klamathensis goyatoka]
MTATTIIRDPAEVNTIRDTDTGGGEGEGESVSSSMCGLVADGIVQHTAVGVFILIFHLQSQAVVDVDDESTDKKFLLPQCGCRLRTFQQQEFLRASGVDTDRVSVMEGDSVTLNTGVQTNQQVDIRWYYNDICIAQINGDLNKTCTDVKCNEDNEIFRDRLKLDHQTGSLTITNITNTDSGEYTLQIFSSGDSETIFNVNVQGVSAAEIDEVKRNEGESVSFDPPVARKPNDVMLWYFNDTHITEITGNLSDICTDVQCNEDNERFRDRLKLDHQTGSLTITHTRNTDSGEYKLLMIFINSSFSITRVKRFNLTVIDVPDSGRSSGAGAGIVAVVLLVFVVVVAAGVIYYRRRQRHIAVPQSMQTIPMSATTIIRDPAEINTIIDTETGGEECVSV